ncbi:unnamed protein product, partial [marine sediment metagenome]
DVCNESELDQTRKNLINLISTGRLPISRKNIRILKKEENVHIKTLINEKSSEAGLTLLGFRGEQLKHDKESMFTGYENVGNIFFVNARQEKKIN